MKTHLHNFFSNHCTGLFPHVVMVISTAFIITTTNIAYADIYKYVDEQGVLHLTNVPTNHKVKYVMILKEKRILFNANLDVTKYDKLISKAADKFNLDSALIKAIIKAESNFNHRAVSRAGAQGLMQLMPSTASALNVDDSFHPEKILMVERVICVISLILTKGI